MPVSSRPPSPERAAGLPADGPHADESTRLAAWLQRTREAERAALARELHDELGAILTAARLDVAWLAAQPCCHEPELALRIAALQRVLGQGIELKRRIVEDLHPTVLTHLGLVPALEQLIASSRQRFEGRLVASLDESVALTGEPALALYRIVQESLTNIHKYADARTVRVSLKRVRGRVELSIDDDGAGFDVERVGCGHHGIAGMRQRMVAVGGRFEVASTPGVGTSIRASLAMPGRARAVDAAADAPVLTTDPARPREPRARTVRQPGVTRGGSSQRYL